MAIINNIRMNFTPVIDIHKDSFDNIKLEVDRIIEFLNTKRYNILSTAESIYQLKRIGERIYRYRTYENINLSIAECDLLNAYIKDKVHEFLKEPVDNANIYLYNPLDHKWILVSSKGYLWVIYGDTEKQINKAGEYLERLLDEDPSLLELKYAAQFADKLVIQRSYEDPEAIIGFLLTSEKFINARTKILKAIKTDSIRHPNPID